MPEKYFVEKLWERHYELTKMLKRAITQEEKDKILEAIKRVEKFLRHSPVNIYSYQI